MPYLQFIPSLASALFSLSGCFWNHAGASSGCDSQHWSSAWPTFPQAPQRGFRESSGCKSQHLSSPWLCFLHLLQYFDFFSRRPANLSPWPCVPDFSVGVFGPLVTAAFSRSSFSRKFLTSLGVRLGVRLSKCVTVWNFSSERDMTKVWRLRGSSSGTTSASSTLSCMMRCLRRRPGTGQLDLVILVMWRCGMKDVG